MIKIDFVEPDTPEWADWKSRCAAETQKLKDAHALGQKIAFKSALYGEVKEELNRQFHGKCAFCERLIDEVDQHVDVEHFRPKGAVTDINHEPVEIQGATGGTRPHPGYYWLAYEWRNLLPACQLCNQPSTKESEKRGKRNRFPIKPASAYATCPEEVAAEQALLLNPMWNDPAAHLKFDPGTGRIIGVTDEGKACVEVFSLNSRDKLVGLRRQAYATVLLHSKEALLAHLEGNEQKYKDNDATRVNHLTGEAEFALAGRQAVADHRARLEAYQQHRQ